ncbi:translation initiation factor SUI1 [Gorgonomyces haynaldii]|nr:translation initiation factor SUI1 [Gorgonomyces haynaldii]
MDILNLQQKDPFTDTTSNALAIDGYIHIRIQQRNGRKTLTTVQGLPKELDLNKLVKAFKKEFACSGTIVKDEEMGDVIQMSGDQRLKVQQFIVERGITKKDKIKVHGF